MKTSSISKPSFTDQQHGQQPGSSVVVLMEEQARVSKATGDQLQLLYCCGNAQCLYQDLKTSYTEPKSIGKWPDEIECGRLHERNLHNKNVS